MLTFILKLFLLLFFISGCSTGDKQSAQANPKEIRQPAVAGQFYPSDPQKLRLAVEKYLEDAREIEVEKPVAIISPHAGYIYSGQFAADAFKQAAGEKIELVVILGTNHTTAGFNDVSIYRAGAFKTPLGNAAIDAQIAERLIEKNNRFVFNKQVHAREHSVEVQIPFVQVLFPDAEIVPVVVGCAEKDLCKSFGEALAEALHGKKALIVASTDLTHYPAAKDAKKVDGAVLRAIETMDPKQVKRTIEEQMSKGIRQLSTCACGEGPVLTAMYAAKAMGATRAATVSYGHSGDALIGTDDRVVGYGAVVMDRRQGSAHSCPDLNDSVELELERPIPDLYRSMLLDIARETITRFLTTETLPIIRDLPPELSNESGAFVTLNKHGHLRGCIGRMPDDMPLCRVIGLMALQAAFQDQRFQPVELHEVDDIEIEISVLTPYEPVDSYRDIVLGRDGIVLRKPGKSAVYLPQVAPEQGWDTEETLSNLSVKAGLPPDGWRNGAQFLTFQAEVFGEE